MRVRRTRRAVRKHGQQQNERGKSREKKPHVTSMKKSRPKAACPAIFSLALSHFRTETGFHFSRKCSKPGTASCPAPGKHEPDVTV
jgi:hypothetical protein